jgi:excisionase family DNA binding protein
MISKEFYTTGEAAELLNISRSTVSRKFDRSMIVGEKNPITGERRISRESLLALAKRYNLPIEGVRQWWNCPGVTNQSDNQNSQSIMSHLFFIVFCRPKFYNL